MRKADLEDLIVCMNCGAVIDYVYIKKNESGDGICPSCKESIPLTFEEGYYEKENA